MGCYEPQAREAPGPHHGEDITTAELDAIRELRSHPGYHLHTARIHAMIGRRRDEFEQDQSMERTWRIRGYLAALRDVLTIPEVLKEELAAQLKKER
jgi:hypothetical protein